MKDKRSSNNRKQGNNGGSGRGRNRILAAVLLVAAILILAWEPGDGGLLGRLGLTPGTETGVETGNETDSASLEGGEGELPEFNGENYVAVNGGVPEFPEDVYARAGLVWDESGGRWKTEGSSLLQGIDPDGLTSYEYYGELDELGRCTLAYGCLGEETMPPAGDERGDISHIHPSGWAKAQRWERCHLIAWALSDEDDNERNLVTGTHYMNYDGMRPLEEEVEHYIWDTGNHVLYMSRPVYAGDELIARGVQMTAWSVEDEGKGISFNVYCFNVTPGAEINYETGIMTTEEQAAQAARLYVVNKRSGVFHYPSCEGAKAISRKNRKEVTATRLEMTEQGYIPCGYCEP